MLSVCICTFNCLCYCQCKPALILANAFIHCLQLAGCPVQCMTGIYTYNKSINVELSTLTGYTKINMCVCVCVCACVILHARTHQMRCLRDIVAVTLWDMQRKVDILEDTGELPIKEQLRLKRLQWFGHLQRMPDHRPQKQQLICRLRGKKRRPGGTCLQWVDVISRDLTEIPQC